MPAALSVLDEVPASAHIFMLLGQPWNLGLSFGVVKCTQEIDTFQGLDTIIFKFPFSSKCLAQVL